jgi:hypothetical protein
MNTKQRNNPPFSRQPRIRTPCLLQKLQRKITPELLARQFIARAAGNMAQIEAPQDGFLRRSQRLATHCWRGIVDLYIGEHSASHRCKARWRHL